MPNLANGFLCFGPSFFVTAAFILSQIATKRCYYVRLYDSNTLRDVFSINQVGIWCYEGKGTYWWSFPENVTFDSKFEAARGFSITTTVIGALCWIFYLCAGCKPFPPVVFVAVGFFLLLNCLFEGLTFLVLQSTTFCSGPDLGCTLSTGGNCGIAACVLWFVSSVMSCAVGQERQGKGDEEGEEGGE